MTDSVKSSIKAAIARNSNIQLKEIEIADWGFIQGFGHISLRLSNGYGLPSKEVATKAAQDFIAKINKDRGSFTSRVLPSKTPIPYLFPIGLQHDYTREMTENNKPQYWEVNFRLHLNSGLPKQNDCIVYGGSVAINVGANGIIIGIRHSIRTYVSSVEADLYKVLNEQGNDIAKNLNVIYLFDFRKNIITPYFLKIPLKSKEAQPLDNFTVDKNYQYPDKQDTWKIDKTNLIPACKESTILDYGKYQCIANRTLVDGDIWYLIKPLMDTQNVKISMLFDHRNCELASSERNLQSFTIALNETFAHFGIKSSYQRIHFLAQIALESALFTTTNEFASGNAYNPSSRKDAKGNGNTEQGDGPRYKGRGFMQLTWRNNYLAYFTYIANHFNRYRTWNTQNSKTLENDLLDILQQTNKNANRTDLTPQKILELLSERKYNFYLMLSHSLYFASDSAGWYWSVEKKVEKGHFNLSKIPLNAELVGLPINDLPTYGDRYITLICYLVNGGANGIIERQNYYKILANILKNDFLCDI
ncbi:MAG: hypothetical protein RI894_389 [Bacteroidota bacterium]